MKVRKFHKKRGQRRAFIKGLLSNLIMKERIVTTQARAKVIKQKIDRLINIAKRQDLVNLRRLLKTLPKKAAFKLYYELASQLTSRNSGYTRIAYLGWRKRDGGKKALVELVKDIK